MNKHRLGYCEGKDRGNKIHCLHQIYLTGTHVHQLHDTPTCTFVHIPTDLEVPCTNTLPSLILRTSFHDAIQYQYVGGGFLLQ